MPTPPPEPSQERPDLSAELASALAFSLALSAPEAFGGIILRGPLSHERQTLLAAIESGQRIPLNVERERLVGGLDLAATLASGTPRVERGLLSDEGPLIVPCAERLSSETAGLLALLCEGTARTVEDTPLAPRPLLLLDEAEGDDPALDLRLEERIAFVLPADLPPPVLRDLPGNWREVAITAETIGELCAVALAFGVPSLRAAVQVVHAAKAIAALDGAGEVRARDAQLAASLVIAPKATRRPQTDEPQDAEPPEAPPQQPPEANEAPQEDTSEPSGPQEDRLVEAVEAALDNDLLAGLRSAAARRAQAGRAGQESKGGRGRPAGVRAGLPGRSGRLALVETLTAAAPWRNVRAAPASGSIPVRRSDIRIRRMRQKAATLTVFCVDASGSQAFARMAEAKGAVERLLAASYVRRDEVALIAFRRSDAELLLPPTASLARAKRALAALPAGGGTPLAAGLTVALRVALKGLAQGREPTLVVLTDGRANVPMSGEGRARANEEATVAARLIRSNAIAAILLDTGTRPQPAAAALAAEMGARYAPLRQAGADAIANAAGAARPRRTAA